MLESARLCIAGHVKPRLRLGAATEEGTETLFFTPEFSVTSRLILWSLRRRPWFFEREAPGQNHPGQVRDESRCQARECRGDAVCVA